MFVKNLNTKSKDWYIIHKSLEYRALSLTLHFRYNFAFRMEEPRFGIGSNLHDNVCNRILNLCFVFIRVNL